MVSGSAGAMARSSRQPAASVSMSKTEDADPSLLQRVAQHSPLDTEPNFPYLSTPQALAYIQKHGNEVQGRD